MKNPKNRSADFPSGEKHGGELRGQARERARLLEGDYFHAKPPILVLTARPEPVTSGRMANAPKRPGKTIAAPRPENLIRVIRGEKVMLDADLAALYDVPTKRLNEAVRRNLRRFPQTFMFRLSRGESAALRSQFATLETGRGRYSKYPPLAFTEHGVVMLSSVLNSERAIEMSILVVNAFVRMRELIASNKDIAARVEKLERGHERAASVIEVLVEDIDRLAHEVKDIKALPRPLATKRRIGFGPWDED